MLDSEFRTLLKKEYDFKENHLILVDYLFHHKDNRFSAEDLWDQTEVPKGRIYDFLNDLIDWGFLDVEYTKPKTFKLRPLKAALQSAIKRKERMLTETERRTIEIANKMERMYETKLEGKENMVQLLYGSQDWYLKCRELLMDSMEVKLAVRTPELFLLSERSTTWRRRYYEMLKELLDSNRIKVQYLFSLRETLDITKQKENLDEVLTNLEAIMSNNNIEARYYETSAVPSMMLTKERALLGFVSPREHMVTRAKFIEAPEIVNVMHQIYDGLFEEAPVVDKELINKVSMI